MMYDVVGMGLIAVLGVLVVVSLSILPNTGGAAPRRAKSFAPTPRRSPPGLPILSAFKALSPSRS
jgi:hypothetical protein